MDARELLRRVRLLELRTRAAVEGGLGGQYRSVFRGSGLAYEDVREYEPGDDLRAMEWNVTARLQRPFVKVYREERELTVMLLLDVSASVGCGARRPNREVLAEIAALLAFSATRTRDRVGAILFSDRVERFIPPARGRPQALRIVRQLLSHECDGTGTSVAAALEHVSRAVRRRAIVFVVSDFNDDGYQRALRVASRQHDVVGIEIVDPDEGGLPRGGLLLLEDAETGERRFVDAEDAGVRRAFAEALESSRAERRVAFRRARLDRVEIASTRPAHVPLARLFRMRERRS
jgi:uncharacterized protein (DUF58 family)